MSEALPDFRILRPATLPEALALLEETPDARLMGGGTDLVANMRHGLVDAATLIDISAIPALKTIEVDASGIHMGAGASLREIAENAPLKQDYTVVAQAANSIAGPGHREAGTLGGNLCVDTRCLYYNQSHWWRKSNDYCLKYKGTICHVAPRGDRCRAAYSGDLAPALMVLGAEVEIASKSGTRRIPLEDLFVEDGMDYLTLAPCEIIVAVHIPPTRTRSGYEKLRVRGSIDFPLAGVAAACETTENAAKKITLAFTGIASRPVLVSALSEFGPNDDPDTFFAELEKQVKRAVTPQRTTTIAPHYRRLAIAALASRLARGLL